MHAVFYRSLNLGHPGSPTRDQLEGSLLAAGAQRVRSFQTNGTVLIEAADPVRVVSIAAGTLAECAGYEDAAMVRSVASLREVLEADHFAGHSDERTYRETFTFFEGGRHPSWSLPWTNARDDVDVIHVGVGVAVGIIRKEKSSAGSVTAEVERETGGAATTRTKGSVERLLRAAERW